jgi:hypothetical protein
MAWCWRNENLVLEKRELGAGETRTWCWRNENLVLEKRELGAGETRKIT